MPLESDAELRSVFARTRVIAVLGAKAEPGEEAWNVPRYLERAGYTVRAVNPRIARWGDAPAWPSLAALPERADLIDVFRAPAHLPAHVEEILALLAARLRLVPARDPARCVRGAPRVGRHRGRAGPLHDDRTPSVSVRTMSRDRIVYSSQHGRTCPHCGRPVKQCVCRANPRGARARAATASCA